MDVSSQIYFKPGQLANILDCFASLYVVGQTKYIGHHPNVHEKKFNSIGMLLGMKLIWPEAVNLSVCYNLD